MPTINILENGGGRGPDCCQALLTEFPEHPPSQAILRIRRATPTEAFFFRTRRIPILSILDTLVNLADATRSTRGMAHMTPSTTGDSADPRNNNDSGMRASLDLGPQRAISFRRMVYSPS